MEFKFKGLKQDELITKLTDAMGDRKISKLVNFDLSDSNLKVTISKLGKSTLEFENKSKKSELSFKLKKEKIAFSHKAFKGEFTEKIIKIIEKAGGVVV